MQEINDREYLTPPDNEPTKIHECYFCDSPIYEGEDCYSFNELIYCEDCVTEHFKIVAQNPDTVGDLADLEYHDQVIGR